MSAWGVQIPEDYRAPGDGSQGRLPSGKGPGQGVLDGHGKRTQEGSQKRRAERGEGRRRKGVAGDRRADIRARAFPHKPKIHYLIILGLFILIILIQFDSGFAKKFNLCHRGTYPRTGCVALSQPR